MGRDKQNLKRFWLASLTLLCVGGVGLALWQNVTARRGVITAPLQIAQASPDYAPALIAANNNVLTSFGAALKEREASEGTLSFPSAEAEIVKSRAKRALASAPLSAAAITQIATADFLQTLNWSDRDMLVLAKSRNARNRQTLLALSDIDLRSGNFKALLETMDLRHRLGSLTETDFQIIRGLSAWADQRKLIESQLAKPSSWGADYFKAVISNWTKKEIIENRESLFIFLKAQSEGAVRQDLLNDYFLRLERLGLYDVALADWSALDEAGASSSQSQVVYNSRFEPLPAPPPFNWRSFQPALALAEIEPSGGLYASSSAPKRALLAEQLIKAPTGRALRLSMTGAWQYTERQGHFFWRLSCLPAEGTFYDVKISDKDRQRGHVNFDIPLLPDSCAFQKLQLYSEPGGFNQRVSLRMTSIEIAARELTETERQQQGEAALRRQP